MTTPMTPVPMNHWRADARTAARDLLGRYLVRRIEGARSAPSDRRRARLVLKIIETEAYLGTPDRASHAYNDRQTERTRTLHLPGGCAYVYLIYGMYNCLNVVAGDETNGEAVLIRAGAAIEGVEIMAHHRGMQGVSRLRPGQIAGGPGKLCQALVIDRRFDAHDLDNARSSLFIAHGEPVTDERLIVSGPRIGIDYAGDAKHWPLRFGIRGHPEMSKPVLC